MAVRHWLCWESFSGKRRLQHILVVDDDPAIRDVVSDILEMSDYCVKTACNGAEALDRIRVDRPAAVLLDLMMPVMDGRTFLLKRAADPALATIPVLIFTAGGDCHELKRLHDIAGCLHKTVDFQQLLAAVRAVG